MRILGSARARHGILTDAARQLRNERRRLTGALAGREGRRGLGVYAEPTGIVETVLCGVVGREPARDGTVDALSDCIVPILRCAKSSSFVRSDSST